MACDEALLRELKPFQLLDDDHRATLAKLVDLSDLPERRVLFRAGDPGEELFLIKDGSIVVSKPVTGRVEQVLSRLGPGEVFGEMSVLGDEPHRSATCQAEIDSVVYSLDRDSLNRFITGSPLAAAKFFQHMAQVAFKRLRDASDLVAEVTRWGLEATGLDIEHK